MLLAILDDSGRFRRADPFQALFELIGCRRIDIDHLGKGHGRKEGQNQAEQHMQAFHCFISSFGYQSLSDQADSGENYKGET